MKFERGLDPRRSMRIGLGPEAVLADIINGALSSSQFQDYVYDPSERSDVISHSWIKRGGGAYFSLFKSSVVENEEGPEEYKQYFIEYDAGGIQFGSLPVYDFLISMGVGL